MDRETERERAGMPRCQDARMRIVALVSQKSEGRIGQDHARG